MITGIFGFLFIAAFVAALAIAMAFLLDVAARKLSLVARSLIAAFFAGFLPMLIPIVAVFDVSGGGDWIITLLPLIVGGIVASLLVGFPVAYFFSRGKARKREDVVKPEVFE